MQALVNEFKNVNGEEKKTSCDRKYWLNVAQWLNIEGIYIG